MVTNFEPITQPLTQKDLKIIPYLVNGFKTHNESSPITSSQIVSLCNSFFEQKGMDLRISEPKLRKCCNYIRSNGILPLIATSNGYFVSTDKEMIKSQIESLKQRANSMINCAAGLEKFL